MKQILKSLTTPARSVQNHISRGLFRRNPVTSSLNRTWARYTTETFSTQRNSAFSTANTTFSTAMFRTFSTGKKAGDDYDNADSLMDDMFSTKGPSLLDSAVEEESWENFNEMKDKYGDAEDDDDDDDGDDIEETKGANHATEVSDEDRRFGSGEKIKKIIKHHPNAVLIDPITGNRRDPRHGPPLAKKLDNHGHAHAIGGRKTSKAFVWIKPGTGECYVNRKNMVDYFNSYSHRVNFVNPFLVTDTLGDFDVYAFAQGGGVTGQAEAIRHGISRALNRYDPKYRFPLKKAGYLTRDRRTVERKKVGLKKARKAPTWVKR